MSDITKDKEVLQDGGRKNALKNVEASKRDQAPRGLMDRLEEIEAARTCVELWQRGNSQRQEWLEKQEKYLAEWDEWLVNNADGPFEGSSNLHLPTTFIVIKTLHARFLQALLGVDPPFQTKARTEAFRERAPLVQDVLSYTLKDWANCYDGVHDAIDDWIWNWASTGTGILKARWEKRYERFIDIVQVPQPRTVVDPQTGIERQTIEIVEKEERVTKVKFDGPIVENKMIEDVVLVGHGDPQEADAVIEQFYLTASELWTLVDQKIFRKDVVEEVIQKGGQSLTQGDPSGLKQARAQNAGISDIDQNRLDRYRILESYVRLDVDGSGINTDIICWVNPESRKILHATYLHRVNKSGKRPFFKEDYYRRPGALYGSGLVEVLFPFSTEMDAMHNIRIDSGLIANMPFGFYRATSSLDPEVLQYSPGSLIPLDDPRNDVYFPNIGHSTAFGIQEEAALQTLIERLTGVNDILTGTITGAQGATRTATGARALLGESSANLDVHLKRLQRSWKRFLKYMLHMLQQRIPAGLSFRVTGEDGNDYWRWVRDQKDIDGMYDIELDANSSSSNSSIRHENALFAFQIAHDPILLQTGIVSAGNIYEAAKEVLKSRGLKDYNRYITKPPDYQYLPTPEEEANRILRGIEVPILPNSDHEGFIKYFEEIFNSDELLGQFNEEQSIALFAQAQRHRQALEALKQAQAAQANALVNRTNSQNAAIQVAPGQNAMLPSPGGNTGGTSQQ